MPPNETRQWVCAGTKRIFITEGESSLTDGTISVFCHPPSNAAPEGAIGIGRRSPAGRLSGGSNDDDCLHVLITDGVHTFHESIARTHIRHMASEDGQELEKVTSILLRPNNETFKVSYKRVEGQLFGGSRDSKNTTSVKVSVRKTCSNSVVRPVWEGQLDDIVHSCEKDLPLFARCALPQTESPSGLAFSLILGDTINKLHKEIGALRTENKQLEANTLRWKSTGEHLSNQWETEKSELTGRFLTLFNEHKARHVETQKELDHLKGKKQRTGTTIKKQSSVKKNREKLSDNEDEHDFATYDAEEVNRLASGTKRRANDRQPMANPKQSRHNSECDEDDDMKI
mmetsp:Transcript_14742/g.32027  ORF Transcript_14742/g.32027 Transcript_14742/m.32027 type:complete len:343 (-) Transcript_14742:216-1244(-)|eukprot:CAMPEP_0172318126 /NCGR_PEP_ID=MMETSP1058-20130122/33920_1 /TAXON_ID=83371 /ORGANISM="Detonula confervacea, Strain CCMP 353" /LENGTH=342 /DNA_ID=CAMNT_0013032869 /DNA_START=92 /DNA_END=1120 /DNA_ORIENTATION=+